MPTHDFNEWDINEISSLVNIGTHSLFASVRGTPRRPEQPITIIFPGAGDVASSYPAVARSIAPFTRVLLYDRSGLGRSPLGPNEINAATAAAELSALLKALDIHPPYLLVAHSYGGIVAREFLHANNDAVAGMVLADCATERAHLHFTIPDPNIAAVLGDMNYAHVTGLKADSKLSQDEWRARSADIRRGYATGAAQAEAAAQVHVCETLAEKRQFETRALGDRPLSVVRCNTAGDYRRIYDAGVEAGNGTTEQRAAFKALLERWSSIDEQLQGEQLGLSSVARCRHLPDCGHNVHLLRPDCIAEEIQWVAEHMQ